MADEIIFWLANNWEKIGIGLLLIIILYGGSRPEPWWVFGREFREERAEKNEYKSYAFEAAGIASKALDVAEQKATDQ